MNYEVICAENRERVNKFIRKQWLTTEMVLRGEPVDMTRVDGIVLFEDEEILALLTYVIQDGVCEITSLDSLRERQGIGSDLIRRAISAARDAHCRKIVVVTTNDNINAIRFYQKRGFDMARLFHNAMDVSRRRKPEIPLIGENGIPLRHEIEFEYIL